MNEVGSGLMIEDTLAGVPVKISASLIMTTVSKHACLISRHYSKNLSTTAQLFGFGSNNYYRDVLVLFAFIAGFGLMVIFVVWFKVRERR